MLNKIDTKTFRNISETLYYDLYSTDIDLKNSDRYFLYYDLYSTDIKFKKSFDSLYFGAKFIDRNSEEYSYILRFRNITEILYYDLYSTDIDFKNDDNYFLYYSLYSTDIKFEKTFDILSYKSTLVDVNIPEYQIVLDFFGMSGGIY